MLSGLKKYVDNLDIAELVELRAYVESGITKVQDSCEHANWELVKHRREPGFERLSSDFFTDCKCKSCNYFFTKGGTHYPPSNPDVCPAYTDGKHKHFSPGKCTCGHIAATASR